MLKLILLSSLIFLSSCSEKKEDLRFSSFDKKFEYCVNYIDNSECDYLRPLVILYNDTYLKYRGEYNLNFCTVSGQELTDTCKNYYYTTSYKRDLKSIISDCSLDNSLSHCSVIYEIRDMINYIKS